MTHVVSLFDLDTEQLNISNLSQHALIISYDLCKADPANMFVLEVAFLKDRLGS